MDINYKHMKKIFFIAASLLIVGTVSAQIAAFRQGNSASVEGYSLPRTVITVTVTQEREVVLRGPYAKYASQYLGITGVAQSDKESYKLLGAQLGFYEEPDPTAVFLFDEKSNTPQKIFNWLSIAPAQQTQTVSDKDFDKAQFGSMMPFKDVSTSPVYGQTSFSPADGDDTRLSNVEKSPEQMAADAAAVVFRIRQRRLDLLTGEVGEGVYGAGLKAALDEMQRIEDEYMALFIGKRYIQRTTKAFDILPVAGKNRITAFRFSESKGIVADTDVSGRPINIELTPEPSTKPVDATGKKVRTVLYRVPLVEQVKLVDNQELIASMRIPVYQFGNMVEAPVVFGAQ